MSKWNNFEDRPEINYNLLQVSVRNRVVVFDLSDEQPNEKFFLDGTHQFFDADRYVDAGIVMSYNTVDQSQTNIDGHFYNSID